MVLAASAMRRSVDQVPFVGKAQTRPGSALGCGGRRVSASVCGDSPRLRGNATFTSPIRTGTPFHGSVTAAQTSPEPIPNTATATAIANSKLLLTFRRPIAESTLFQQVASRLPNNPEAYPNLRGTSGASETSSVPDAGRIRRNAPAKWFRHAESTQCPRCGCDPVSVTHQTHLRVVRSLSA